MRIRYVYVMYTSPMRIRYVYVTNADTLPYVTLGLGNFQTDTF